MINLVWQGLIKLFANQEPCGWGLAFIIALVKSSVYHDLWVVTGALNHVV